jgi:hypothetical protein
MNKYEKAALGIGAAITTAGIIGLPQESAEARDYHHGHSTHEQQNYLINQQQNIRPEHVRHGHPKYQHRPIDQNERPRPRPQLRIIEIREYYRNNIPQRQPRKENRNYEHRPTQNINNQEHHDYYQTKDEHGQIILKRY